MLKNIILKGTCGYHWAIRQESSYKYCSFMEKHFKFEKLFNNRFAVNSFKIPRVAAKNLHGEHGKEASVSIYILYCVLTILRSTTTSSFDFRSQIRDTEANNSRTWLKSTEKELCDMNLSTIHLGSYVTMRETIAIPTSLWYHAPSVRLRGRTSGNGRKLYVKRAWAKNS